MRLPDSSSDVHQHHLIPKRFGGSDDPSNLTPPISIALHAEFHRWLWLDGGHIEDYIAWKALTGRRLSESERLSSSG